MAYLGSNSSIIVCDIMFEIKEYSDKFGRVYKSITGDDTSFDPKKIYVMIMTYNCEDYIKYCIDAFKNQNVEFVIVDNGSTDETQTILTFRELKYTVERNKGDLSYLANTCLKNIPPNSWVFYVNPDEILFDLPDNYLNRLASFMEKNEIYCGDVRFPDFVNNYSTLFAHFDWGEGAGNYWTARRLFYYTGRERFIHPVHFNVTNMYPFEEFTAKCKMALSKETGLETGIPFNNEHTGEWTGTVARLSEVKLYHYGKLRGAEKQRGKGDRLVHGDLIAAGQVATIPFRGRHPSVLKLW